MPAAQRLHCRYGSLAAADRKARFRKQQWTADRCCLKTGGIKWVKIVYTKGTGIPHRRFEDEFLSHKKCSEWWYTTGYLEDEEKTLFSFQFTLAKVRLAAIRIHMLLTIVTDIRAQKHYYAQRQAFWGERHHLQSA